MQRSAVVVAVDLLSCEEEEAAAESLGVVESPPISDGACVSSSLGVDKAGREGKCYTVESLIQSNAEHYERALLY
jgi:hypothetical protein